MVYGLNVKPEWGFDPKIEWEGPKEIGPIPALNPVNGGGVGWGGVPVDGTHFPKWVKWQDPNGNLVPDFDKAQRVTVSERAKAVIESLEPGVHQFFPVEYQDMKGNFRETRYWFVVCNRLDSVDRERTTMVLRKGTQWYPARDLARRGEPIPDHIDPKLPPKIVFNLEAIGNRHMWVDKHLSSVSVWLTDQVAALFKSEGLNGIRFSENGMEQV